MLYRIALIDERGRTAGHLRFEDSKAQWPTGHAVLGDSFEEDEAHAIAAGWSEYLAAKQTGYSVRVRPITEAFDGMATTRAEP